jgi:hypothetical protein
VKKTVYVGWVRVRKDPGRGEWLQLKGTMDRRQLVPFTVVTMKGAG